MTNMYIINFNVSSAQRFHGDNEIVRAARLIILFISKDGIRTSQKRFN